MQMEPYWEGKHYAFFQQYECEYFPCHAGADPENQLSVLPLSVVCTGR